MIANIMKAYVTAPNKDKKWTLLGPVFGNAKGHKATVGRALYRLKYARASFRGHLADCMEHLGYKPNKVDPNLWMKVCTRDTQNRLERYYSYMLVDVHDILCIHDDLDSVFTKLDKYFLLKPDSIGKPDIYL